jgi:hypothetical protein
MNLLPWRHRADTATTATDGAGDEDNTAQLTDPDQEDTASYHNGTPDGQRPWWEGLSDYE